MGRLELSSGGVVPMHACSGGFFDFGSCGLYGYIGVCF